MWYFSVALGNLIVIIFNKTVVFEKKVMNSFNLIFFINALNKMFVRPKITVLHVLWIRVLWAFSGHCYQQNEQFV